MSTFVPYDATCPACRHRWQVHIAQGLHITRLPEIRKTIVDGTFQVHRCPACQVPTVFESTMIYSDFDRHEYVAVETSTTADHRAAIARHEDVFRECFELGPEVAQDTGKLFKRRLVYGLRALREKILLWDAGLDDRIVEAVKGDLVRAADDLDGNVVLRISRVLDGGHMMFSVHEPLAAPRGAEQTTFVTTLGPPIDFITAPAAAYAQRASDLAGIERDYPWLGSDWVIDVHDSQ